MRPSRTNQAVSGERGRLWKLGRNGSEGGRERSNELAIAILRRNWVRRARGGRFLRPQGPFQRGARRSRVAAGRRRAISLRARLASARRSFRPTPDGGRGGVAPGDWLRALAEASDRAGLAEEGPRVASPVPSTVRAADATLRCDEQRDQSSTAGRSALLGRHVTPASAQPAPARPALVCCSSTTTAGACGRWPPSWNADAGRPDPDGACCWCCEGPVRAAAKRRQRLKHGRRRALCCMRLRAPGLAMTRAAYAIFRFSTAALFGASCSPALSSRAIWTNISTLPIFAQPAQSPQRWANDRSGAQRRHGAGLGGPSATRSSLPSSRESLFPARWKRQARPPQVAGRRRRFLSAAGRLLLQRSPTTALRSSTPLQHSGPRMNHGPPSRCAMLLIRQNMQRRLCDACRPMIHRPAAVFENAISHLPGCTPSGLHTPPPTLTSHQALPDTSVIYLAAVACMRGSRKGSWPVVPSRSHRILPSFSYPRLREEARRPTQPRS